MSSKIDEIDISNFFLDIFDSFIYVAIHNNFNG